MTPEQKKHLAHVHEVLAETLSKLHKEYFIDSAKLTILVRQPEVADGDLIVTDDEPHKIIAAIEHLAKTGDHHPPPDSPAFLAAAMGVPIEFIRMTPGAQNVERIDPHGMVTAHHDRQRIDRFVAEYRWLSNFWPCEIELNGHVYASSEHAFQAAKAASHGDHNWVAVAKSPGEAKRRGRKVTMRPDWEDVKIDVMRQVLRAKFAEGSRLATQLMQTAPAELIEGNHWGDTFWGVDDQAGGKNWLGRLLMERRAELLATLGEDDD